MTKVQAFEVETTSTPARKPSNGETLITLVLDETGSMYSVLDATISSVNDYIGSQKAADDVAKVNLFKFSQLGGWNTRTAKEAGLRPIVENMDVVNVAELNRQNFTPSGSTNLYDAIGLSIKHIENQLKDQDSVPDVLMVIVTDGGENASTEYKLSDIKSMIADKEAEGWTFVYLGANQDAWSVGSSFGLSKGQTMTYSVSDMDGTMETLSAQTTAYRSMRSTGAVAYGSVTKNFFDPEA